MLLQGSRFSCCLYFSVCVLCKTRCWTAKLVLELNTSVSLFRSLVVELTVVTEKHTAPSDRHHTRLHTPFNNVYTSYTIFTKHSSAWFSPQSACYTRKCITLHHEITWVTVYNITNFLKVRHAHHITMSVWPYMYPSRNNIIWNNWWIFIKTDKNILILE